MPVRAVVGGAAVAVLGAAGLVRAAMPQSAPDSGPDITVTGAFVRAPAPPTKLAAAYFTVHNDGDTADRLVSVRTPAAGEAVLHDEVGGRMVALASGAAIPAHARLVLAPGGYHVMLSQLTPAVRAGQRIELTLTFAASGTIDVAAAVIGPAAPAPTPSAGR